MKIAKTVFVLFKRFLRFVASTESTNVQFQNLIFDEMIEINSLNKIEFKNNLKISMKCINKHVPIKMGSRNPLIHVEIHKQQSSNIPNDREFILTVFFFGPAHQQTHRNVVTHTDVDLLH